MIRRAAREDLPSIERVLSDHDFSGQSRFGEIVRASLETATNEYVTCIDVRDDGLSGIAAYGMIAGTIGTAAVYGALGDAENQKLLLEFARCDLLSLGAQRIVAELPDTDRFSSYRDALASLGHELVGRVEDFYSDGAAMLIFAKDLKG